MSKADIKTIAYLTFIKYLASFVNDKNLEDYAELISKIYSEKSTGVLSDTKEKLIRKLFKEIDDYSKRVTIQVSHTFVYSLIKYIAYNYLFLVKDEKRKNSWKELSEYCDKQLPVNYRNNDDHTWDASEICEFIESKFDEIIKA